MMWIVKLLARPMPLRDAITLFNVAKKDLAEEMLRFYQGDHLRLFAAINWCDQYYSFPLPEWITFEVQKGYQQYLAFETPTLDKAFGFPPRSGHLKPKKFAFKNAWNIYQRCEKLHGEGWKLEDPLFTMVGKEFSVGKTKIKELYLEVKRFKEQPKK
jgi:hypothetical protein